MYRFACASAAFAAEMLPAPSAHAEERQITLTQVSCQFLEAEGTDHGYKSRTAEECTAINGKTGDARLAQAKTLRLKPGRYVLRVANRNVPYELGFWLRGSTLLSRAVLPSVSGGGIRPGQSRDYEIELKPGEYVYSCPPNPTPDYRLVVQ